MQLTLSLILTCVLGNTPLPPVIINKSALPLFFENEETAFLHCQTMGNPPPTIQWSKIDLYETYIVPLYGVLRIHQFRNGSLGFFPIHEEDWGFYACQARNDHGSDVAYRNVCVGSELRFDY